LKAISADTTQSTVVAYSGKTKTMHLETGKYNLEVFIDPDNRAGEEETFRGNNRVIV